MKDVLYPQRLVRGDTVATVTLSWGGAGVYPYRYNIGKKNIEKIFGIKVVEMEHTLKSPEWIYKNPKARADDLITAFNDKNIKGIFTTIGGNDSVNILPFLDLKVIEQNPKIFMGYSDTTVSHLACFKAGLSTYYGPSVMAEFAENINPFPFMIDSVRDTLFTPKNTITVQPAREWTDQYLAWETRSNQSKKRKLYKSKGWTWLQGQSVIRGQLLGGNIDTLEKMKIQSFFQDY